MGPFCSIFGHFVFILAKLDFIFSILQKRFMKFKKAEYELEMRKSIPPGPSGPGGMFISKNGRTYHTTTVRWWYDIHLPGPSGPGRSICTRSVRTWCIYTYHNRTVRCGYGITTHIYVTGPLGPVTYMPNLKNIWSWR